MHVKLFGLLAERIGSPGIDLDATSLSALRKALDDRLGSSEKLVYSLAVDHRITHDDLPLSGNEEIAALPPFAGG